MNNTGCVKIAVSDDNVFFSTGLRSLIDKYSRRNGMSLSVLDISCVSTLSYEWESFGSVFISLRNFHGSPLIHRALLSPPSNMVLVKNCIHRINEPSLYAGFQTIYRNQSASEIYSSFRYFIPSAGKQKADHLRSLHRDTELSLRERHTAMMLASGAPHADIAKALNITVQTVSSHKRNIMRKLSMTRNTELSQWLLTQATL